MDHLLHIVPTKPGADTVPVRTLDASTSTGRLWGIQKVANSSGARHATGTRDAEMIGCWGSITDRGRARAINEDALLADPPVFIVADGMGGHAAGDIASWAAVYSLTSLVGHGPIAITEMVSAIEAANDTIVRMAAENPSEAGMGTTLSGITSVLAGGMAHWMVFNVGDSRVYRSVDGDLQQLTVDHSEVEEMVVAGMITREQAQNHPRRNIVTRSLGTEPPPTLDYWVFPPMSNERFLICSDGLTNEIGTDIMQRCLVAFENPQQAAEELLRLALEAGGRDNITVIVVDGANDVEEIVGNTAPRARYE
jgi:serine/threonine protein phosphatase PrpC